MRCACLAPGGGLPPLGRLRAVSATAVLAARSSLGAVPAGCREATAPCMRCGADCLTVARGHGLHVLEERCSASGPSCFQRPAAHATCRAMKGVACSAVRSLRGPCLAMRGSACQCPYCSAKIACLRKLHAARELQGDGYPASLRTLRRCAMRLRGPGKILR